MVSQHNRYSLIITMFVLGCKKVKSESVFIGFFSLLNFGIVGNINRRKVEDENRKESRKNDDLLLCEMRRSLKNSVFGV